MKIAQAVAERNARDEAFHKPLSEIERARCCDLLSSTAIRFGLLIEGRRPIGLNEKDLHYEAVDMGHYPIRGGSPRIVVQPRCKVSTYERVTTAYELEVLQVGTGIDLSTTRTFFHGSNSHLLARTALTGSENVSRNSLEKLTDFHELLDEVLVVAGNPGQLALFS